MARWLAGHGVEWLLHRMMALSVAYQQERPNVEAADMTALVIRALGLILGKNIRDDGINSTTSTTVSKTYFLQSQIIAAACQKIIEFHEIDINTESITSTKIGRVLRKMRFKTHHQSIGGNRGWLLSLEELDRWAGSYGMDVGEITGLNVVSHESDGTGGTRGTARKGLTGGQP